jgi:hypothetical protein
MATQYKRGLGEALPLLDEAEFVTLLLEVVGW